MNSTYWLQFLLSAAQTAVILPGLVICLYSVEKWLILPVKKLLAVLLPLFAAACLVCAALGSGIRFPGIRTLLVFIPLGFVLLLALTRLERVKLVYVYLCMLVLLSFGVLACQMKEAFIDPALPEVYLPRAGLVVQWCFSGLALLYFFHTRKKLTWILENMHTRGVWYMVLSVPVVILLCNLMMSSMSPAILLRYRLFRIYLTVTGALCILLGAFQSMFYAVAKTTTEKYEAENRSQLLQSQQRQYTSLQHYIEKTNRLQHDMKQMLRTMNALANRGEFEQLRLFLGEYEEDSRSVFAPPQFFCPHISLNALLSHYAQQAKEAGIEIDWQVDVPRVLPVSEVDLSGIFGNLLDNAITACQKLPQGLRHIRLRADCSTADALYIVMVNDFPGNPSSPRKEFKPRRGIGLTSVTATAEKYGGAARFFTQDGHFHSNVMLGLAAEQEDSDSV